jgi:hypothetical protein
MWQIYALVAHEKAEAGKILAIKNMYVVPHHPPYSPGLVPCGFFCLQE